MQQDKTNLPDEALQFLAEWLGDGWSVRPLHGDASARAYYRIVDRSGQTFMLAYYPEEVRGQLSRFLSAYDAIREHSRVPEVLRHSPSLIAQSDVGDRTLLAGLKEDRSAGLAAYRQAIDLLVAFQKAGGSELNPPFTAEFFFNELEMTRQYYVGELLGHTNNDALISSFTALSNNIANHQYVLCHRDFHGENVHIFNDDLYMIDYQDLRLGPDTYDLASLLRDRGVITLLAEDAERDLIAYYAALRNAGPDLMERYLETLLQRSIKILGTFAKQAITRGRLHYLDFIPPTLDSIRFCLERLPQYAALATDFPMDFSLAGARASLANGGNL